MQVHTQCKLCAVPTHASCVPAAHSLLTVPAVRLLWGRTQFSVPAVRQLQPHKDCCVCHARFAHRPAYCLVPAANAQLATLLALLPQVCDSAHGYTALHALRSDKPAWRAASTAAPTSWQMAATASGRAACSPSCSACPPALCGTHVRWVVMWHVSVLSGNIPLVGEHAVRHGQRCCRVPKPA